MARQAKANIHWPEQAVQPPRLLSEDMISLFLGRVVPASFFVLMAYARMQELLAFISQANVETGWLGRMGFYAGCVYKATAIAFAAMVVVVFIIRMQPVRKSRNPLHIGVALAGSFMMTLCAAAPLTQTGPLLTTIAALVMVAGTAFTGIALIFLGRSFSITPEARRLVTGGLYAFVRHPMYLGELLGSLGLILPSLSLFSISIFAVFCFTQIKRMDYEEGVLQQAFPSYGLYKRRTARLIPGVY